MGAKVLLPTLLAFVFAPLLLGIINRVKAFFAGRRGQPLFQAYYDISKLLRKGAVYSRTTTWVFRAGPMVGLTAAVIAVGVVPLGTLPGALNFSGDLLLLACMLGLMRFFTVIAALDTGSAFEGMGASREVQFSALAEPALLLALAAVAREQHSLSLSGMLTSLAPAAWVHAGPQLALVCGALLIVFLTENARIPIDDPDTHLELTMIHEVMALDHSGPDLAFVLYGAALKLWVLGAVLVGVLVPVRTGHIWIDLPAALAGMVALAVLVGIIESAMARLRLIRIPQLLISAGTFAVLALIVALR